MYYIFHLDSLTFKKAVKLVKLISSSSHTVDGSNAKFNKINKVCVLATSVTWNSIYLINLGTKEGPFSDKYQ